LPTSDEKKLLINGEEAERGKKKKLPPGVDWQAKVREKQAELDKADS
jgi:hypothetical protein